MRAMPIPMRYKKGAIIFNMFSALTVKSQTLMLALAVSLYAFSGNALTLADNGASDYQIVLPESRNNAQIDLYLKEAATLIQRCFKEASGTDLPVVKESEANPSKSGIFLGDTKLASTAGIEIKKMKDWEYAIKSSGKNIIVAGNDHPGQRDKNNFSFYALGTVKGVTAFLESYVNVRFLMPGYDGMMIPVKRDITVPENIDIRVKPLFDYCTSGHKEMFYDLANNFFPAVNYGTYGGHSHPVAIPADKYYKTNPEYFILRDGKRYLRPEFPNYCISNPQVQELIYQELLNHCDQGYEIVQLGQGDGFTACQCDKCFALYGVTPKVRPDGDRREYNKDPAWGDKLWIMHRAMAERLLKDRPNKKLAVMAYGPTGNPPESFKELPANVTVEMARYDEEAFNKWKNMKIPGGCFVYIYNWGSYQNTGFTPKRTPEFVAKQVKLFKENNVRGIYRCGFGELFGLEGPVYYLYGQLLSNPDRDASNILNEYYKFAYGAAEAPMKRFFDLLHQRVALDIAGAEDWDDIDLLTGKLDKMQESFFILQKRYPDNVLEDLEKYLTEAEKSVPPKSAVETRIKVTRMEFNYLKLTVHAVNSFSGYSKNPTKDNFMRFADALDKRSAFINQLTCSKEKEPKIMPVGTIPIFGASAKSLLLTGGRITASPTAMLNFDAEFLKKQDILPGNRLLNVKTTQGDKQPLLDPSVNVQNSVFKEEPTYISCKYDNSSLSVVFTCAKTEVNEMEYDKFTVIIAREKPVRQRLKFVFNGNAKQATVSELADSVNGNAKDSYVQYATKAKASITLTEAPSADTVIITLAIPWEIFKFNRPTPNEIWLANFARNRKEPKADYAWEIDLNFFKSQKANYETLGKIKFE